MKRIPRCSVQARGFEECDFSDPSRQIDGWVVGEGGWHMSTHRSGDIWESKLGELFRMTHPRDALGDGWCENIRCTFKRTTTEVIANEDVVAAPMTTSSDAQKPERLKRIGHTVMARL